MSFCCNDCGNLNKNIKILSDKTNSYIYGCNSNKHICGWIQADSELKIMGCSNYVEKGCMLKKIEKQLSLFD